MWYIDFLVIIIMLEFCEDNLPTQVITHEDCEFDVPLVDSLEQLQMFLHARILPRLAVLKQTLGSTDKDYEVDISFITVFRPEDCMTFQNPEAAEAIRQAIKGAGIAVLSRNAIQLFPDFTSISCSRSSLLKYLRETPYSYYIDGSIDMERPFLIAPAFQLAYDDEHWMDCCSNSGEYTQRVDLENAVLIKVKDLLRDEEIHESGIVRDKQLLEIIDSLIVGN